MDRRKVVLTGACGYVAQRMFRELDERYDLVPLDIKEKTVHGTPLRGLRLCDLTQPDNRAYAGHFAGADAVIHCAFVRGGKGGVMDTSDARFRAELQNVVMAYNVYKTALENGVRRVVMASSNHAADFYERLIWADKLACVTPDMLPLSDNFYGWAKAAYELLGFVFAAGSVAGRRLEVVQLRIGGPRDDADLSRCKPGDIKRMHRGLGAYLSQRDQVQLFIRSVEEGPIEDGNGIPFQIFYGVSGNTHNFWSIANAREVIGYRPMDNSQVNFAERIAQIASAARESSIGEDP